MIVMKFGGSSVRSADDIRAIITIINENRRQNPVIVISAFSQVTNRLEKTARLASEKYRREAKNEAEEIFSLHDIYADEFLSGRLREAFRRESAEYRIQIDQLIDGVSLTGEITARTNDQFSSYGERLSSLLLALSMQAEDLPAELIRVDDYLYTTADYGRAVPVFNEVRESISEIFLPVLGKGGVPVTAGFIGVTRSGIWTTMGRESSDYTATLLGAYLPVSEVQLWKEAAGIRTTDPLVVQETNAVDQLSYGEALELANLGAKVLHPRTILPVMEQGIPIRVLSSRIRPSAGTVINSENAETGVKSITYRHGVDLLRISSPYHANGDIMQSALNQYFKSVDFDVHLTLQIGSETAALIDGRNATEEFLSSLGKFGRVDHITDTALVSIVGNGIGLSPGSGARFADLLNETDQGILISGASPRSISAVVPDSDARGLVKKLHKEYFKREIKK